MIYQKLVRDHIPEIITSQGDRPVFRILEAHEFSACLARKLDEEVAEFHSANNLEELADILEVIYALAENMGYTKTELMKVYQEKHVSRGGFSKRIFLISKEG